MKPYTYLIGWPEQNKFYYGAQWKSTCDPDRFWVDYFTSSPEVRKFRAEHGDPPLRLIRRVFETKEQVQSWEHRVLRRLKAHRREDFLNKTTGKTPSHQGHKHTLEAIAKIKAGNIGKKRSAESIENNRRAQTGVKRSDEVRKILSLGHTGLVFAPEHRANIAKTKIGRTFWLNTVTGQGCCKHECPGPEWVPGKKQSSWAKKKDS